MYRPFTVCLRGVADSCFIIPCYIITRSNILLLFQLSMMNWITRSVLMSLLMSLLVNKIMNLNMHPVLVRVRIMFLWIIPKTSFWLHSSTQRTSVMWTHGRIFSCEQTRKWRNTHTHTLTVRIHTSLNKAEYHTCKIFITSKLWLLCYAICGC